MELPKDSVMLLSMINMKLRDKYSSLDELCDDMNAERSEIVQKLAAIGYSYNAEINQFR